MLNQEINRDSTAFIVNIPTAVCKRGGRKLVVSPAGAEPWAPSTPCIDTRYCEPSSRPSTGSSS